MISCTAAKKQTNKQTNKNKNKKTKNKKQKQKPKKKKKQYDHLGKLMKPTVSR